MTETLTRYRTADYLETEEDIAAYLEAAMEEAGDDSAFIVRVLANIAEARSMAQLARDAGMTRAGLYKALSAQGNPRIETAQRIARALGLELTLRPAP